MRFTFPSIVQISAVALLVNGYGCQATSTTDDGVTDSHTNWLMQCDADEVCGDLSCLCGVCTRSCDDDAACAGLGVDAACDVGPGDECAVELVCVEAAMGSSDANPDAAAANTGECEETPPVCGLKCGSPQSPECMQGQWRCPPLTTEPCPPDSPTTSMSSAVPSSPMPSTGPTLVDDAGVPCLGTSPNCVDVCGAPIDASCAGGVWTCPASGNDTCPEPKDAGGSQIPDGAGGANSSSDAGINDDGCQAAADGEPCDVDGQICGGPCLDTCSFCNMSRCSGGVWQRLEAFPAPCYGCGDTLTCDPTLAYCKATNGEYSCEAFPAACDGDRTCSCLEAVTPGGSCTGETENELLVEVTNAPVSTTMCSCTVFTSGSSWCTQGTSADPEHPIEWVCDDLMANPPLEELNADCVVMPTNAARWCCAESFAPVCQ